jgi:amino acid adenylation domain-containing protein
MASITLIEAIAWQTQRAPQADAILFEGRAYSYAWLEQAVLRIQTLLAARPGDGGVLVGVCMHRTPDMVAALLAVMRSGCGYLPLDPALPPARLAHILDDAGPWAVLTEADLVHGLAPGPFAIFDVAQAPDTAGPPGSEAPARAEDLAYVLYTSGSTGKPKGVEVTHGAVMNLITAFQHQLGFAPGDVALAATTIAFDISVLELFAPLACGAAVLLAGDAVIKDPEQIAALIDASHCTIAQATPSMWRYMVETGWAGKPDLRVICGGELLPRALADDLMTRCASLWNAYGPTETTVWSMLHRVQPYEKPVPIGKAIRATTLHVLDEAGQPVAPGAVGELHIGGAGLARGYRGRPDLTQARFVTLSATGERVYKTGDLVRQRPDGALECLGRSDHQVKIRGHRVELGDVEAGLMALDGVALAAAATWTDPSGSQALAAYILPRQGARLDTRRLRRDLETILPAYMTPTRWVQMDAMPMTPSGKIDRKALPSPHSQPESIADGNGSAALIGQTELRLAAIWSEGLGVAAVGPEDNFFDLGGYSMLTTRLLRAIDESFGVKLSVASLFQVHDLRAMAQLIDKGSVAGSRQIVLQAQGKRPPIYWIDVGPQVRQLARALGLDQPFIGINLLPEDEERLMRGRVTIEALVDPLIEALRAVQPHGPYYIGGWCRWGVVAYAVAERLIRKGEEVKLLTLLDSVNFDAPGSWTLARRRLRRWIDLWLVRLSGETLETSFSEKVEAASVLYRPPPYPGAVALFRTDGADPAEPADGGWGARVQGQFSVTTFPGSHRGILKPPHVYNLAAQLAGHLAQASEA